MPPGFKMLRGFVYLQVALNGLNLCTSLGGLSVGVFISMN